LQKQIDDLKAITTNGGKHTNHEEQVLQGLERELKAVKKARDALGDKAPALYHGSRGGWDREDGSGRGVLGKRRRWSQGASGSDEDVSEDVRKIPMPRDTPPPIPKDVLDKWYAQRRAQREAERAADDELHGRPKTQDQPPVESKTVYEAKPIVRDLRKEAVTAFMPTAVKMKMTKGKGQGGLMEPEEADELEQQGYLKTATTADEAAGDGSSRSQDAPPPRLAMVEDAEDSED
jgi:hypothetical protein